MAADARDQPELHGDGSREGSSPARGRRVRFVAPLVAAALACSLVVATASGDVSHVGWPHTIAVWFAGNGGQVGVGTDGNDMLLGGAGSRHDLRRTWR